MTEKSARTIYLIANAHLDPVWLWRWPDGCTEIRSTCRAAVDFLTENPVLKFSRSSAGDVRWLLEMEPTVLERMRALALEGRWENVGGWWTQPDCNIPCGESFVRQALYGQQFFRQYLGTTSAVGYNVDSFGHHGNLPQILKKCGLDYYVHMRPSSKLENPDLPEGYYYWEGIDGTRILAYHLFDPYCATECWGLDSQLAEIEQYMQVSGLPQAMLYYGMGDHGGGPTRQTLKRLNEIADENDRITFIHATPHEAFTAMAASGSDLPVHKGEMQIHAAGCYAAHSEVKRLNRRAEEALLAAERMATVTACLTGIAYPREKLTAAWQDLLWNQFHDILAGSSIREAYVDTRDQMGRAIFTAEERLNAAQQQLASHVDTRGDGQAMLIFNPHPFPVNGLYETEDLYGVGIRDTNLQQARFYTKDGAELPVQHVAAVSTTGGSLRFLVPMELPPLGYQLFRLGTPEQPAEPITTLRVNENILENSQLRVKVDEQGIHIDDLLRERPVIQAAGIRALVIDDPSDTWGHDSTSYDQVLGAFEFIGVKTIEEGPLRGRLRAEYRFQKSTLWLDILLDHDARAVELRGKVLWLERLCMLKMSFPVNAESDTAVHEIPYAAITRTNTGEERPMQQWIDLADENHGLVVINDGKYSVSVHGQEIRQTIMRSVPYAWSATKMYPWEGMYKTWHAEDWMLDQGEEEFRLLLLPHDGDRDAVTTPQKARLLNRHPMLMVESSHSGTLPPSCAFLTLEGDHVRVEVVKAAEDGHGIILRAVETAGGNAIASFNLPTLGVKWQAAFTPWEIKTFRIDDGLAKEEGMLEGSEKH